MTRPTPTEYFLRMAALAATRGTCLRRQVGCVLVDPRGHVLSTGYNGVAVGIAHCNEWNIAEDTFPYACPGVKAPSGTQLDACGAIHAEQNALLQCRNVWEIETCYVTHSPCIACVKLLMNTSCTRIVFLEPYAHNAPARALWMRSVPTRTWRQEVSTWNAA